MADNTQWKCTVLLCTYLRFSAHTVLAPDLHVTHQSRTLVPRYSVVRKDTLPEVRTCASPRECSGSYTHSTIEPLDPTQGSVFRLWLQCSHTTRHTHTLDAWIRGGYSTRAPGGTGVRPFDPCVLVLSRVTNPSIEPMTVPQPTQMLARLGESS